MQAFENLLHFLKNLNPATVAGVRVFMESGEIHCEVEETGFNWNSSKHLGFVESDVYTYRNELIVHEEEPDIPEPFKLDNLNLDELEFVLKKIKEWEEPEPVDLPLTE